MPISSAYIHIPFCTQLCHYCNFTKVFIKNQPVDEYLNALDKEIAITLQEKVTTLKTLYIGGGTPSALTPDQLQKLMNIIEKHFRLEEGAEFSVEANPSDLTHEKIKVLQAGGVNRISLGVQTFHDHLLKKINRDHSVAQIDEVVARIIESGISNLNMDLIYGLPGETLEEWKETLQMALSYPVTHISAYSLILEPKTYFYNLAMKEEYDQVEEELEATMFEEAMDFLPKQGFHQYEISNYAKPGYESKHNLVYWNNEPYFGFGAGAHSYNGSHRIHNVAPISHYIRALLNDGKLPIASQDKLTKENQMEEEMFLGLRKCLGVSMSEFQEKFGCSIQSVFGEEVTKLISKGLLEEKGDNICLTRMGKLLGNEVFEKFLL